MGGETLVIDPAHDGVLGEDRPEPPAAKLGRLLGEKIDALALHRREDEPEVGAEALRQGLALDGEARSGLGEGLDDGLPLAVAAVEEQNGGAFLPAEHMAQIMAARRIESDRGTRGKRRLYIETRDHPVCVRARTRHLPFDWSIQLALNCAAVLN